MCEPTVYRVTKEGGLPWALEKPSALFPIQHLLLCDPWLGLLRPLASAFSGDRDGPPLSPWALLLKGEEHHEGFTFTGVLEGGIWAVSSDLKQSSITNGLGFIPPPTLLFKILNNFICIMYFGYLHPHYSFSHSLLVSCFFPTSASPLFTSSCVWDSRSLLRVAYVSTGESIFTRTWTAYQWLHCWRKWFSLYPHPPHRPH